MECKLDGNIEKILKSEGRYVSSTRGVSMLPMIKTGRDVVIIEPKRERLKQYDVALYRRGDAYVLHRVIEVQDGRYLIRGDNTYVDEFIPEEDVIGVLAEYYKGRKLVSLDSLSYKKYVIKRVGSYRRRKRRYVFVGKLKGFVKKLVGKKD